VKKKREFTQRNKGRRRIGQSTHEAALDISFLVADTDLSRREYQNVEAARESRGALRAPSLPSFGRVETIQKLPAPGRAR
jgi:hypothetical protein